MRVKGRIFPHAGIPGHHIENMGFCRAGDNFIGADRRFGMRRPERGVDAAEHHGHVRIHPANHFDCLPHPRIPIRHQRGHQDQVRFPGKCQIFAKPLRVDTVAGKMTGHVGKAVRLWDAGFAVRSTAAAGMGVGGLFPRMEAVQAVDIGNRKTRSAKGGCDAQQAQGLGPDVIGRKIVNPRVDAKDMRKVLSQGSNHQMHQSSVSSSSSK